MPVLTSLHDRLSEAVDEPQRGGQLVGRTEVPHQRAVGGIAEQARIVDRQQEGRTPGYRDQCVVLQFDLLAACARMPGISTQPRGLSCIEAEKTSHRWRIHRLPLQL